MLWKQLQSSYTCTHIFIIWCTINVSSYRTQRSTITALHTHFYHFRGLMHNVAVHTFLSLSRGAVQCRIDLETHIRRGSYIALIRLVSIDTISFRKFWCQWIKELSGAYSPSVELFHGVVSDNLLNGSLSGLQEMMFGDCIKGFAMIGMPHIPNSMKMLASP